MRKLEGIQFMRGIAALVVLVYHACSLSVDYAAGAFYAPALVVGKAGVDLFFVISGFVMVASTYERFDDPTEPSRYVAYRISRIFPPYWILSLVVLVYYLYNPAGVNSKHGGVDLVASFLLLPSPLLPLIPVAWTLVFELFFYIVFFCAISFLPRSRLGSALALWVLFIVINGIVDAKFGGGFKTLLLHPYILEFIGGALIGLAYKKKGPASEIMSVLLLIVGFALFLAVAMYFQGVGQSDSIPIWIRILFFGMPSLFLIYGCIGLNFDGKWVRVINKAGDCSYSIYLIHILVIHLGYRLIARKLSVELDFVANGFLVFALIIVSIGLSWIFHKYIEKPSCAATQRVLLSIRSKKMSVTPATKRAGR